MLGAEAIWWLNSALLALLTHAGLLWMLIVAEPNEINKPVETTFIIESLPEPADVRKTKEANKSEPVRDRVTPTRVQEAKGANAAKSNQSDQVTAVQDNEKAVTPIAEGDQPDAVKPAEKVREITSSEPTEQPSPNRKLAPTTETERAQPTNPKQGSTPAATSAAAEKPTKVLAETTNRVQEADRSSGVTEGARAKTSKLEVDRETVKVSPKQSAQRQAAVLAPRIEAVPGTKTIKKNPVPKTSSLPTVAENEKTEPQKTFVFPKNAKRLGPTRAKPTQPIKSPQVSAVETPTSSQSQRDRTKQEPSTERLEQVAVATLRKADRVEPDRRYRDLLEFLKDSKVTGCASVLPTIAADGSVVLSGFAADEAHWDTFQRSMAEELRLRLPLKAATVAKPQCRALTFARTLSGYPRFSLGIKLESTDLISGQYLNGTITDVRDRKVHLLVVDDEGLVQQADLLLRPRVSGLTFSIQMYVSGKAVRTAQMMIALAVDKPLATVTTANQTMAEDFFAAVSEELAETGQAIDIAIVSFYLRSAEKQ